MKKINKEDYFFGLKNSRTLAFNKLTKKEILEFENLNLDSKISFLKENLKTNREILKEEKISKETIEEKIKRERKEEKAEQRAKKKEEEREKKFYNLCKELAERGFLVDKKPFYIKFQLGYSYYFEKKEDGYKKTIRVSNHQRSLWREINTIVEEYIF